MNILDIDGFTKSFKKRRFGGVAFEAVRGISLSIRRNEIFGLVGESGSGKTTLARGILYLDPPTEGNVVFAGVDLGTLGSRDLRRMRSRMQIIFQDPTSALNPRLRVRTSLGEGLRNQALATGEVARRVAEAADLVGIPAAHLDRFPHEFSGGQKQRLVIARSLTMQPEFLILDEPVSNLDVSIQAQIINLLLDLKNQLSLTYLFISHDLNLVAYLSDRIGVMRAGRIVELGRTDDIIVDPLHIYTRQLFSASAGVAGEITRNDSSSHKSLFSGCGIDASCTFSESDCIKGDPPFSWISGERGVLCFRAEDRSQLGNE